MALTTVQVEITANAADGATLVGATVRAMLTRVEQDGVLLVDIVVTGTVAEDNKCLLHLWPNSRGSASSRYRIEIIQDGQVVRETIITVPEVPADQQPLQVTELQNVGPYPPISEVQAVLLAAQGDNAKARAFAVGVDEVEPGLRSARWYAQSIGQDAALVNAGREEIDRLAAGVRYQFNYVQEKAGQVEDIRVHVDAQRAEIGEIEGRVEQVGLHVDAQRAHVEDVASQVEQHAAIVSQDRESAWEAAVAAVAAAQSAETVAGLIREAPVPVLTVVDDHGFVGIEYDADGSLRTTGFEIDGSTGAIKTDLIEVTQVDEFEGIAFGDKHGFIGATIGGDEDKKDDPSPQVIVRAPPHYGGQIGELKAALTDPLYQYIGLVLIGDSITWGSGASGGGVRTPRNESLSDPRNDGTSPSWANFLHQYLGRDYYESAVTATGWPGSPSGLAQFEYSRSIDVFLGGDRFSKAAAGGSWTLANAPGSALGVVLDGASASPSQTASLKFQTTGKGFSVVVQARVDGGAYELFIDGVSSGAFSSSSITLGVPAAYGYVHTHAWEGIKRAAQVELRLVPSASATVLRIEAIRVDRRLRVTNQGLIGTNSRQWVTSLLAAAVRADDSFAFVQLGTNDLGLGAAGTSPYGPAGVDDRIAAIVAALKLASIQPVLLCANAVTAGYADRMSIVRAAIHGVARTAQVDFIDQFAVTRANPAALSDDGTHPSDVGHLIMFENIYRHIEGI